MVRGVKATHQMRSSLGGAPQALPEPSLPSSLPRGQHPQQEGRQLSNTNAKCQGSHARGQQTMKPHCAPSHTPSLMCKLHGTENFRFLQKALLHAELSMAMLQIH